MTSKPVVLRVLITELPTLVERKSKQTALNDKPEPVSLPINDLCYPYQYAPTHKLDSMLIMVWGFGHLMLPTTFLPARLKRRISQTLFRNQSAAFCSKTQQKLGEGLMCRRRLVVVAAQIYIHTTLERLLKNHQLCAINMTLQLRSLCCQANPKVIELTNYYIPQPP